ncbi:MAG TPA: DUF2520 domain-containing protein [Ktedonobacterales bacterium]|nr:DUF2520 domain-containing protein [Ktedonobacterales bacterium]
MSDRRPDLAALGRIGFVGVGAAGSTLARVLADRGAQVSTLATRHPDATRAMAAVLPGAPAVESPAGVMAASDVVFLAVPDDAIAGLVAALPWRAEQAVIHLSGAHPAALLAPAAARGARIAALHPMMTFTRQPSGTPVSALLDRLAGVTWALDCADLALAADLEALVAALGGHVIRLGPDDRLPYHISGVLASNYIVALLGAATELWVNFGVPQAEALRALLPLLRATVENLATAGLPAALTGPVARGDAGTVAAHLAWLDEHAGRDSRLAALRDAYRALGRVALPLAEAKGTLIPEAAVRLVALLSDVGGADGAGGERP